MRNITAADLAFAHHVRYQDAMLHAWMRRTGQGNCCKPEDVPSYIDLQTNEQRSKAEVIEFVARPLAYGQPYTAYLARPESAGQPARIVTFMGGTLARVTKITSHRVVKGFTTDARGSFWAVGIDGRTYYGRHNGRGMYCTMRLAKHQPR